jgi:hypothetical protein
MRRAWKQGATLVVRNEREKRRANRFRDVTDAASL